MSTIRKRINVNHYKSVLDFREDWRLMFNNARTYNQEGSWVYQDADEMEKVFDAAFSHITGSSLPGEPKPPNASSSAGMHESADACGRRRATRVEGQERSEAGHQRR